jgi:hypothetical protein
MYLTRFLANILLGFIKGDIMADSDFLRESGYGSWMVTGEDVPDDWGDTKSYARKKQNEVNVPVDRGREEQISRAAVKEFETFQEAKAWALANKGKSITRNPNGNGFIPKLK